MNGAVNAYLRLKVLIGGTGALLQLLWVWEKEKGK